MATKLYKEQQESGVSYTRCRQINIDNPVNGTPNITMFEERIIEFPDGRVYPANLNTGPGGRFDPPLQQAYGPSLEIPIVDPTTFEPNGQSMTAAQIYAAIFSLYIHLAKARDAAAAQ